jgi:hypothetical protein
VKAFTVLWAQTATDQLADIWLESTDRAAVNSAVEAIDSLLSSDPLGELTSELGEGLRTVTIASLRIIYPVREDDRAVDVATVRRIADSS